MRKYGWKTVIILTLAAMLLASCGGGGAGQTTAATTAATAADATTAADTVATAAATAADASGAASADGAQKPVDGKYDPPITLTMMRSVDTTRKFMPGETWDNNLWTQAFEEKLGIKFAYTQTTMPDEYDQKLNIAIASGDLPDRFQCNYDTFSRLASSGMLAGMSAVIEEYGNEAMKINYDANDGLLRKQLSVDGEIYGMQTASDLTGAAHMLWYRNDWAETVGASQPQTAQELWDMAYAFAGDDPNGDGTATVGFGVSKELWDGSMGLEGWFAMDGAYPTIWIDDGAGGLMHGSVDDKAKVTLQKLQDAYKAGVIDADFTNKGAWAEAPDDIVKHRIGMVIGPIWIGDFRTIDVMVALNSNKATWTSMPVPEAKTSYTARPSVGIFVMTKDCLYPEAQVLCGNMGGELLVGDLAEGRFHDQVDPNGESVSNFFHGQAIGTPFNKIVTWNLHCAKLVTAALESGDTSELNDEMMSYYTRAKAFVDWQPGDSDEGLRGYTSYSIFGPTGSYFVGERMVNENLITPNLFYGANTETMNENLGNLMTKRDELFTAIILGQDVDEGFEEWKTFWSTMQGETITQEVNDWYKAQQ